MTSISIITPCSRPENLPKIAPTLPKNSEWIIVHDAASPNQFEHSCTGWGLSGNAQRNMGMLLATGEYIYFVDDDNIVHPALLEFLETAPLDGTAYVFHQGFKDGRLRIKGQPDRMGIGGIDTAMFLIPKEIATDIWWEMYNYCADGVFIGTIYNKFPERFQFVDRIMAYYNYLS